MRGLRRRMMNSIVDLNVEYITSTAKQEVKTDWIPLVKAKVSAKVMYHFNQTDPTPYAISVFFVYDKDGRTFCVIKGGDVGGRFYHLEAYNNYLYPKENPFNDNIIVDNGVLYEFTLDSTGLLINGKKAGNNTRKVYNTSPMTLFQSIENKTTLDFYGCKCWNNGILERDFVPAKKNGIYGLYDKVNKKFWRSSTGVDFLGKDK